ncbi:hypothetical protein IP92_03324 [Pseudoduganella flava]|uniref:Uncharacterized protein n=1 Tax=Pseudoduganella flava TaxID=871742 RepID=A0A562PN95_9BURK|nr:hypothetical protein [Pseudoduganella flava]QGZ40454.1 hypothetical protein GO485_16260 [Pseudoduganella flava]TWI45894.1 hypothetical protein IP92_03324 [Pseudoduganella flava]
MSDTERDEMEIAACALEALYAEMHADLGTLDGQIDSWSADAVDTAELAELHTARTALHSGMASIQEVLGWLLWVDPDAAPTVRPPPLLRGAAIH